LDGQEAILEAMLKENIENYEKDKAEKLALKEALL